MRRKWLFLDNTRRIEKGREAERESVSAHLGRFVCSGEEKHGRVRRRVGQQHEQRALEGVRGSLPPQVLRERVKERNTGRLVTKVVRLKEAKGHTLHTRVGWRLLVILETGDC